MMAERVDAHGELHRVVFVKRGRTRGEVERESAEKKQCRSALMSVTESSVSVSDVLLFTLSRTMWYFRREDVDLEDVDLAGLADAARAIAIAAATPSANPLYSRNTGEGPGADRCASRNRFTFDFARPHRESRANARLFDQPDASARRNRARSSRVLAPPARALLFRNISHPIHGFASCDPTRIGGRRQNLFRWCRKSWPRVAAIR